MYAASAYTSYILACVFVAWRSQLPRHSWTHKVYTLLTFRLWFPITCCRGCDHDRNRDCTPLQIHVLPNHSVPTHIHTIFVPAHTTYMILHRRINIWTLQLQIVYAHMSLFGCIPFQGACLRCFMHVRFFADVHLFVHVYIANIYPNAYKALPCAIIFHDIFAFIWKRLPGYYRLFILLVDSKEPVIIRLNVGANSLFWFPCNTWSLKPSFLAHWINIICMCECMVIGYKPMEPHTWPSFLLDSFELPAQHNQL